MFSHSISPARIAREKRDFLLLSSLEPRQLLSADLTDIMTVATHGVPAVAVIDPKPHRRTRNVECDPNKLGPICCCKAVR